MRVWNRLMIAAMSAVAVLTAMTSCNTTGCTDNRSSIPLAGFYSAADELKVALDSLDIGGIGAPADSLLLHSGEKATDVYMPLRSTVGETSWRIAYRYKALDEAGVADTIGFVYETIPFFASEECGAMFRYRLRRLTYTTYVLDSVAVIAADSVFTNANVESLKLFFRISNDNDR